MDSHGWIIMGKGVHNNFHWFNGLMICHKPHMTWYTYRHPSCVKGNINTYRVMWEYFPLQNYMLFFCSVHPKWVYACIYIEVYKVVLAYQANFTSCSSQEELTDLSIVFDTLQIMHIMLRFGFLTSSIQHLSCLFVNRISHIFSIVWFSICCCSCPISFKLFSWFIKSIDIKGWNP